MQTQSAPLDIYLRGVHQSRGGRQIHDERYRILVGLLIPPSHRIRSQDYCGKYRDVAIRGERFPHARLAKLPSIAKDPLDRKVYKVLVVDDSTLPRVAARAMLGAASGLRLCGEAASGTEALRAMATLKPDLVLMDVHMPDMDGPATTRKIIAQYPDAKVIAWTVSESSDDLLRMIQAGCSGYVLKDSGPGELQRALQAALRSESPVPRKMIPEVLRRVAERTPLSQTGTVSLTSREMQILRGVAKGHTTKRLAQELGLAAPSVETHLHNIFKKLAATNRGEAVSTALKLGVITLADL